VVAASLREEARRARTDFDTALAAADVAGCVTAVLALEQAIVEWQADTLQGADRDVARRTLRAMIVRMGELARVGARDPREVLGPVVELALDVRRRARDNKDFATSDLVRDRLAAAGIDVRDTPAGPEWSVRS
jgi:cysteinyl-tRNA synthetase